MLNLVNKLRVLIFSIILVWASVSLAFIVQDIYSGPERVISPPAQSTNISYIYISDSGGMNYMYVLETILILWALSSLLSLIFYFKKSLSSILRIILSMTGIFIVIGFAYVVSLLIGFTYSNTYVKISFSSSEIMGSIPIAVPIIILLFILIYFGAKFIPVKSVAKDEDLKESIGKMIGELRFSDDIRGAIMKAYYDLSNMLRKHGIIEEEYLTPREFEHICMKKIKMDIKPFETLVNLFEEARYSNHPLDETQRKIAIEALESIRNALGD